MASKVLVVSVMLLFSVGVVGAVPKYGLRSEKRDDVNCTDVTHQSLLWQFLQTLSRYNTQRLHDKIYPKATKDFFRNVIND